MRSSVKSNHREQRRGSTLVIVIALLGLLVFTGMIFYTFASQEQVASEFFSEAAKAQYNEPNDVWSHMLEHVIVGPQRRSIGSILGSPQNRHSMLKNMFGHDNYAYSGDGIPVGYSSTTDAGGRTTDLPASPVLEMVDSPSAWGIVSLTATQQQRRSAIEALMNGRAAGGGLPEPDVDYTYPDINNLFLAYRGYAIRDVGGTKQQVPVIIPSYFRPQYMKSLRSASNLGAFRSVDGASAYVPTDPHWAYAHVAGANPGDPPIAQQPDNAGGTDNRGSVPYRTRSFRPHPLHIAGIDREGNITLRYLTDTDASDPDGDGDTTDAISAGGFPFLPENKLNDAAQDSSVQGELGIWTGSDPLVYELDADNDGDGLREGIWLDLHYPMQEVVADDGTVRKYVVLHSATIYDLDSLINVNVHGNLAGLPKTYVDAMGDTQKHTLLTAFSQGALSSQSLTRSNLGLGPNEINPVYALMRSLGGLSVRTNEDDAKFAFHLNKHFGGLPTTELELANMLWLWMLMGRGDYEVDVDSTDPTNIIVTEKSFRDLFQGRFGDERLLYAALENRTPRLLVAEMPRPGLSGNVFDNISGPSFGGRGGFDDNRNILEGEANVRNGRLRPFGHPMDFAGLGHHYQSQQPAFNAVTRRFVTLGLDDGSGTALPVDPRLPIMLHGDTNGPERWRGYLGYSAYSQLNKTDPSRYFFGPDGQYEGTNQQFVTTAGDTSDDLVQSPNFDVLIEDVLETVFDQDLTKRPIDDIFSIGDLIALHTSSTDFTNLKNKGELSERLRDLAPYVLKEDQDWKATDSAGNPVPDHREMLTTISNSLRQITMKQPFGGDKRPGAAGVDDDNDGTVDEPDEASLGIEADDTSRWWEFTADSNGLDRDEDGYADGDGQFEFPPRFWSDADSDGIADRNETIRPYSALDPFRPQLRRMISIEAGESRSIPRAQPISINHLVDVDRTGNVPLEGSPQFLVYMQRSGLRLRSVTDHPDISEAGVGTTTTMLKVEVPADYDGDGDIDDDDDDGDPNTVESASDIAFPPNTIQEREFWARRDRQKLARDIYVLLYTLGGAKGSPSVVDYTGTNDPNLAETDLSTTALYSHDQLRRMAQFAVNMVDAMDTDNVVTKFEYDKNLGNGWNLDDDPYSTDFPAAVDQRKLMATDPGYSDALGINIYTNVTGGGLYPEDSGVADTADVDGDGDTLEAIDTDRGVVYGLEAQHLAFSEVLGIRSNQLSMDHPSTPFDDMTAIRDFFYVELQNLLPQTLDLASGDSTTAATALWRIARFDRTVDDTMGAADNREICRSPGDPTRAIAITDHADNEIDGGGRFSISATNGLDLASSAYYLDVGDTTTNMFDGTYELIAPDAPTAPSPTTSNVAGSMDVSYPPLTDLDVIHADHGGVAGTRFDTVGGDFLERLPANYAGNDVFQTELGNTRFATNPNVGFDLVLQRRMNPNMPGLTEADNPWVEVDRERVLFQNIGIQDSDGPAEIYDPGTMGTPTGRVTTINSAERQEPLNALRNRGPSTAKSAAPYRINTLKGGETAPIDDLLGVNAQNNPMPDTAISNTNQATAFDLWQPHFDRNFASTGELLNIQFTAPNTFTQLFERTQYAGNQQVRVDRTAGSSPDLKNLVSAEAAFLLPDFPKGSASNAAEEKALDNRWYRLFQFVEVPSRVHRMLGNYLNQTRLPGKININMIRHLEVYAGLIDDPMFAHPHLGGAPQTEFLQDATLGGPRDRWQEYIDQRDGGTVSSLMDPTPNDPMNTGDGTTYDVTLPGTPNASPFRSMGYRGAGDNGIQDTMLQELATDVSATANRNWLEVGSAANNTAPIATSTTVQRHQVLSKILNNTTTVSNSFIIYGTAAYFEAYEDPNTGFVRVGGRIDLDNPSDNGDSREDAGEDHSTGWQQRAMFIIDRTDAINALDTGSGSFDWERLIKHEAIIE